MKKIVFGTRTGAPAFFDLIVQHPVNNEKGFFRIGDRAAAYVRLLEWRKLNPDRRLVILDMPLAIHPTITCLIAEEIPAEWVFQGIADEIWLVSAPGEVLPRPEGEALNDQPMWQWWHYFNERRGQDGLRPGIKVLSGSVRYARDLRKRLGVPKKYATVQPLFDAPYAKYRNQTPEFWYEFISLIAVEMPVVVLGRHQSAGQMACPHLAWPVWAMKTSVMDSLAMIQDATMHVGGETGTTIWSGILGTNTFGVYANVRYEDVWLAEPLGFECGVRVDRLTHPLMTANSCCHFWTETNS